MFSSEDFLFHGQHLEIPPLKCGNFGQFVLDKMVQNGDKIFQVNAETGETWTYAQTARITVRVIHEMNNKGISKGDIITLACSKRMSVIPIICATVCLGATSNTIDPNFTEYKYSELFSMFQPNVVICEENCKETLEKVFKAKDKVVKFIVLERDFQWIENVKLDWEDVTFRGEFLDIHETNAFIYFTNGTTETTNSVPVTQKNIYHSSYVSDNWSPIAEDTVILSYFPMMSMTNLQAYLNAILTASVFVVANYDREKQVSIIKKYSVNHLLGIPLYVRELIDSPDFDEEVINQIKIINFGGNYSPKYEIDKFIIAFPNSFVHQNIGSTEMHSTHASFNLPADKELMRKKLYSIGRITSNLTGKLIDLITGKTITSKNTPGELLVHSPYMFRGYFNNINKTKEVIDSERFFHTGDIVIVDEDDCFYFIGKITGRIIYTGLEINKAKLEDIILLHPAVEAVHVIGKPAELDNLLPTAFINKKKGFENTKEEEIIKFLEDKVENHERLRGGVYFLNELSKPSLQKVKRRLLINVIKKPKT